MLKPVDIQNTDFKRSFKGYNEEEVDEFVSKIVTHYENLFQENKRLTEELAAAKTELRKKESQEQDVLDLITLTKQAAAEIKEMSNKQAEGLLEEAQVKAGAVVAEAESHAKRIMSEAETRLVEVKRAERVFKSRMRALMETVWGMLEDEKHGSVESTKVYRDLAAAADETLAE